MKTKKRASIGIGFVIFFLVFLVVAGIFIEVYNIHVQKTNIQEELTRACNISMAAAMKDSARMTHEGDISTDKAKDELSDYMELIGFTALNASKTEWGKNIHGGVYDSKVEFSEIHIIEKPPLVAVKGIFKIQPIVLRSTLESWSGHKFTIEIPFNARSKNSDYLR